MRIAETVHNMFPEYTVIESEHGIMLVAKLRQETDTSKTIFGELKNQFCQILNMSTRVTLVVENMKTEVIFEIAHDNNGVINMIPASKIDKKYQLNQLGSISDQKLIEFLYGRSLDYKADVKIEERFADGLKSMTKIIEESFDEGNIDFDLFNNEEESGGILTIFALYGVVDFQNEKLTQLCRMAESSTSIMVSSFNYDGDTTLEIDFNYGVGEDRV